MTRGNRLVLMGNDCGNYTGTYNAVTMFLESLGCGWFGPEALWEEIPDVSSISVGSYQIEHTPQFTNRINRVYDSNREMGTRWYQGGDKMLFGHGLPSLVSRESYFSAHPEWFCLINGQRNPYGVDWWQYCYSNQALATEIAGKVIQFFDRTPITRSIPWRRTTAGTKAGASARPARRWDPEPTRSSPLPTGWRQSSAKNIPTKS